MKCRIGHFYRGKDYQPVPEAVRAEDGGWEVEVDDLFAFAALHGALRIHPPGFAPLKDQWFIWVTDGNSFSQR